ncbi:PTS ascorbate transporter subunit IIA [Virgibacillus necropolis]|uniref:Ascorbate-specific PTS system EIIA component n=2 Tax=Virgibacillus necropolis TaxID=163877 RepID=A0A221MI58_9BACI|nr:PTS ascorbate transporter subunit IIA [Virgibacillus necropolis]
MIQIASEVDSWEDAIKKAAEPLIKKNYINQHYVQAMIKSVKKLGPYIVIAPGIAIAHARPEEGVMKMGISLLKIDHCIPFSDNGHHVSLVFVLAALDSTSHLNILSKLAEVLSDDERMSQIKNASSVDQILQVV